MPGPIIILDDEYAAEVSYLGYHVFTYFIDEEDETVRRDGHAGSVVLSREAVAALADIKLRRNGEQGERDADVAPDEQIDNILRALLTLIDGDAHRHRMAAIRSTARQLAEAWECYKAGQLSPLDITHPF